MVGRGVKLFKEIFGKQKYATITLTNENRHVVDEAMIAKKQEKKALIYSSDGLFAKCGYCEEIIYIKELNANFKTCPKCGQYFRMSARERIDMLADEGSFEELFSHISTGNPLHFPDYDEKVNESKKSTGMSEAVLTGICKIAGFENVICAMDTSFIMGSMGSAVGEKITLSAEMALNKKLPLIIFCASGGARMQEGILSLMQMAKCSAAIARLKEAGLLFLSVLTDPTTGGVTASFAFQGDIIIAEPGALIGFAGARVIEQTIREKLPEGFQKSEFLLEHGLVDKIVSRRELKWTIGKLLELHIVGGATDE